MGLAAVIKATYASQGRSGILGTNVPRVAANDAVGPTNLFTIAGGYVLVTSLIGVVTVVRTGGAAVTQVFSHSVGPTVLCVATITGLATVGTVLTITGNPLDNMVISVGTGVANTAPPLQGGFMGSANPGAPVQQYGMIMAIGTITTTITIATTGATRYFLSYIPLDAGATVVVA